MGHGTGGNGDGVAVPPPQKRPLRVFISHSREQDDVLAESFSDALRKMIPGGVEPLICEQIQGGVSWREWIAHHVNDADAFVLLQSGHDTSGWCLHEAVSYLVRKQTTNKTRRAARSGPPLEPRFYWVAPRAADLRGPLEARQAFVVSHGGLAKVFHQLCTVAEQQGLETDPKWVDEWARTLLPMFDQGADETPYELRLKIDNFDKAVAAAGKIPDDALIDGDEVVRNTLNIDGWTRWAELRPTLGASSEQGWAAECGRCLKDIGKGSGSRLLTSLFKIDEKRFRLFQQRPNFRRSPSVQLTFTLMRESRQDETIPIGSFRELLDGVIRLILEEDEDLIRIVAYTPALGFLAERERWAELRSAVEKKRDQIRLACLSLTDLQRWHGEFENRRTTRGFPIVREDIDQANHASEALFRSLEPRHVRQVPGDKFSSYYMFSNSRRAIFVQPVNLPPPPGSPLKTVPPEAKLQMFGVMGDGKEFIDIICDAQDEMFKIEKTG